MLQSMYSINKQGLKEMKELRELGGNNNGRRIDLDDLDDIEVEVDDMGTVIGRGVGEEDDVLKGEREDDI